MGGAVVWVGLWVVVCWRVASDCAFKVRLNVYHRSLPRRLDTFVLTQKYPKSQVSRDASLRTSLSRTTPKMLPGLESFCPGYPIALRPCKAKSSYALTRRTGRQHFRGPSEACLLTGSEQAFC